MNISTIYIIYAYIAIYIAIILFLILADYCFIIDFCNSWTIGVITSIIAHNDMVKSVPKIFCHPLGKWICDTTEYPWSTSTHTVFNMTKTQRLRPYADMQRRGSPPCYRLLITIERHLGVIRIWQLITALGAKNDATTNGFENSTYDHGNKAPNLPRMVSEFRPWFECHQCLHATFLPYLSFFY